MVGHHHAGLVPLHQHEVGFTTTDILQALRGQGFASDCSGSRFDCILGSWHRHVGRCGTSRKGGRSCSHWNQKCILDHGFSLIFIAPKKFDELSESRLNKIMASDVNKSNVVFPVDQDMCHDCLSKPDLRCNLQVLAAGTAQNPSKMCQVE